MREHDMAHNRAHDRAGAFAAQRGPAASIGELVAMAAFSAPCCGHIALCDGACRDSRYDRLGNGGPGNARPGQGQGQGKPGGWNR